MKATRFMRQPFYVAGYKVTEDNLEAIAKWCQGHVIRDGEKVFVRVPVDRPTNKRQTEAYVGTWVTLSRHRDEKSFKVYTEEWLKLNFVQLPDDDLGDVDISDCEVSGCMVNHPVVVHEGAKMVVAQFQAPATI